MIQCLLLFTLAMTHCRAALANPSTATPFGSLPLRAPRELIWGILPFAVILEFFIVKPWLGVTSATRRLLLLVIGYHFVSYPVVMYLDSRMGLLEVTVLAEGLVVLIEGTFLSAWVRGRLPMLEPDRKIPGRFRIWTACLVANAASYGLGAFVFRTWNQLWPAG